MIVKQHLRNGRVVKQHTRKRKNNVSVRNQHSRRKKLIRQHTLGFQEISPIEKNTLVVKQNKRTSNASK